VSLRIAGGRVLTPAGWIHGDVSIEGAAIVSVGAAREGEATSLTRMDAAGLMVVPGFIDLQINGGFGHDFTARPEAIWDVGACLPRHGVTAFLPTLVSSPPEVVHRAMAALRAGPPADYAGARPLGLHCEGPMLAERRRGAHQIRHLRQPSLRIIEGWTGTAGVRMVTIAPELPGAEAAIRELVERGIVVSAGHSDATCEEALKGFDAGVVAGTHLFNAMKPFHHRDPGLAGALLARSDTIAGLIADGSHVHPGAVATAWQAKGPGGLALVTDAIAAMGTAVTRARLGDSTITVEGAAPRSADGRLAGSVLTLDGAVRNLVAWVKCEPEEAFRTVTSTPARILEDERRGVIEPGAAADLALLSPDLAVAAAVVDGRVVFDGRAQASEDRGREP
jgi:N-acetylglucosamine-6-phosphate deacetylase